MRNNSSLASGNRGDASDHPESVSKEASSNEEASGHPKIVKTEEVRRSTLKIVKVREFGEVVVDVKDIRVRINDVIIKITFDDSGLKEILVDDEIIYKK